MEFDGENPRHVDALEGLREAFKHYRRRAQETLPLLIKKGVPFKVHFDLDPSRLNSWQGLYGDNVIDINPFGFLNPMLSAKTLAHETGHHLFRTWLTEPNKAFWRGALNKDWTQLDLSEVLAEWHKRDEYWASFMMDLRKTEPVLYLQVEGALSHSNAMPKELRDDEGWSRANLERYLAGGGKRTIRVPSSPITAYAAKNPEEAFCEAVSMLVAYGPRAVLAPVREWLRIIFGGQIKIASAASVARAFLGA